MSWIQIARIVLWTLRELLEYVDDNDFARRLSHEAQRTRRKPPPPEPPH